MVLEFACVAVCSLLVRQHGSHACQSHAEAFLLDVLVSVSRNDEVMRNNLCGGIAFGLTLVPSHPPALALCVFSRRFVVSSYGGCVCASRGGLESACDWASVRGAWCLWSAIVGLVQCPRGFYGSFDFLSSSRSLQVSPWPCSACCSFFGNYVCSVTCYVVCICF